MAKLKISDYSSTSAGANLNTDINSIDIDEGCAPSGINNAIRTLMAQLKDFQTGVSGDSLTLGGALSGTSATFSGNVTASAISGASLTLSGALSGTSATFSGNITASAISGASLTLSGNITASAISGASMTLSGDLTVDTNTLYVDSTNNRVGIGTASPACKTDVSGTIRSTTVGAPSSGAGLELSYGGVANTADILAYDRTGASFKNIEMRCSNLIFNTGGGGERMRINSSGFVGIGTSSPNYMLTVNGGASATGIQLVNTAVGTGSGNGLLIYQDGVNSRIQNIEAGVLTLWTSNTERMRIDSSGNVGIGGTAGAARLFSKSSTTDNTTYPFIAQNSASSNLFFVRSDGYTNTGTAAQSPYNQTVGSAANTYIHSDGSLQRSTSSLKYKKNVQDATHGLQEVLQIRPITYESKNELESGKVFGGLIAEEIDAIGLTEFVQYDKDGNPDALAYGNMVSLCIKAIQELKTENDTLKSQLSDLETRIQALENQ